MCFWGNFLSLLEIKRVFVNFNVSTAQANLPFYPSTNVRRQILSLKDTSQLTRDQNGLHNKPLLFHPTNKNGMNY